MTVIERPSQVPVILPKVRPPWHDMSTTVKVCLLAACKGDGRLAEAMVDKTADRSRRAMQLLWHFAPTQRWAQYDCRVMFATPEMANALHSTSLKEIGPGLLGTDIRFRYPAFMIWWPELDWLTATSERGEPARITQTIVSLHEADDMVAKAAVVDLSEAEDVPEHVLSAFTSITYNQRTSLPVLGTIAPHHPTRGLFLQSYWSDGQVSAGSIHLNEESVAGHVQEYDRFKYIDQGEPGAMSKVTDHLLRVVLNLLLLMQSHPVYVTEQPVKQRTVGQKKAHGGTCFVLARPMRARQLVTRRDHVPSDGDPMYHVRPHEREAHWRMQPHGEQWELEHPDSPVVHDHKGRRCHMIWIHQMWVDSQARMA